MTATQTKPAQKRYAIYSYNKFTYQAAVSKLTFFLLQSFAEEVLTIPIPKNSFPIENLPNLRLSTVRLRRLTDELIGYHMKNHFYCDNNRLLQQPVVLLDRLPTPVVEDDDLQPAADLIENAELLDCENEFSFRFFHRNLFTDNHPEDDPLALKPHEIIPSKSSPPHYRFNASIVHGMATKHLDQMVEHMPSPATSFSTELDDEDVDEGRVVIEIPDSLESSAGTE